MLQLFQLFLDIVLNIFESLVLFFLLGQCCLLPRKSLHPLDSCFKYVKNIYFV